MNLCRCFAVVCGIWGAGICLTGYGQVRVETEFIPYSGMENEDKERLGGGLMQRVAVEGTVPLSVRNDSVKGLRLWALGLRGVYGRLCNQGEAARLLPADLLNVSMNVMHRRSLSARWSMVVSAGAGMYAPLDEIRGHSVLFNGGVLFSYKLKERMSLGGGAAVTNSLGLPMLVPVVLFDWRTQGRYELSIQMSGGVKVSVSRKMNERFRWRLVAMEMDGMTSVVSREGRSLIYAFMQMRSYVCPELKVGKSTTLYVGAGGSLLRGVKVSERSLTTFYKSLTKDEFLFKPSATFLLGMRYGF